jgi:acetolactate synthase-1/2/3 large subunit
MWGNRAPRLTEPLAGVHALGGGIGQGLAMGIGAAVQAACRQPGLKTWCLVGDGGFILNLGELATAVQERCDLTVLLMNDQAYGVIKNIQDAQYGGRKVYADLHTPDYALLSAAIGITHCRVGQQAALDAALRDAADAPAGSGPRIIEVDMLAFGPFKTPFAGPPVKPGHALPAPPVA